MKISVSKKMLSGNVMYTVQGVQCGNVPFEIAPVAKRLLRIFISIFPKQFL